MSGETQHQSLSEIWNERFDDRDDEELACHVWAQQLALRDQAMANPIKAFELPVVFDPPAAANDSTSG